MKELTPQQIEQNWNKLRNIIQDTFEGERLDNLNKKKVYGKQMELRLILPMKN